jgi:hypothetical protein
VSPVPVPQYLYIIHVTINDNKTTREIKCKAFEIQKFTRTSTPAADGAQTLPVPVPQHLDSLNVNVTTVSDNKVAIIIKRNTSTAAELPLRSSLAAQDARHR